jgi:hypothetical protein
MLDVSFGLCRAKKRRGEKETNCKPREKESLPIMEGGIMEGGVSKKNDGLVKFDLVARYKEMFISKLLLLLLATTIVEGFTLLSAPIKFRDNAGLRCEQKVGCRPRFSKMIKSTKYCMNQNKGNEYEALKDVQVLRVSDGKPMSLSDVILESSIRGRCLMPLTTHYGDLSSFEMCQKLRFVLPDLKEKGFDLFSNHHISSLMMNYTEYISSNSWCHPLQHVHPESLHFMDSGISVRVVGIGSLESARLFAEQVYFPPSEHINVGEQVSPGWGASERAKGEKGP